VPTFIIQKYMKCATILFIISILAPLMLLLSWGHCTAWEHAKPFRRTD